MRSDPNLDKRGAVVAAVGCAISVVTDRVLAVPTLLGLFLALVAGVAVYYVIGHVVLTAPFRRELIQQKAASAERRRLFQIEARGKEFAGRLHGALELADHEPGVVAVVGRAFGFLASDTPAELLLADASYAHVRQAATNPDHDAPGCNVVSPHECAAVRRGQTSTFASGNDLDTCPHLRSRPGGDCSAVCVPVTVLGAAVGVLHTTGEAGVPPGRELVSGLEAVASLTGARLGMIRALARSEVQASTDPLTGMLNRRSLENAMRPLRESARPYVVIMVDLDHFKDLNDTHGHDAGDRALRVFAEAVRASLRPGDLACRHGGEEFVLVLPDCGAVEAAIAAERLRETIALANLSSGSSPGFTASFGVADSATFGDDLAHLLAIADGALRLAKQSGRDRVVTATRA